MLIPFEQVLDPGPVREAAKKIPLQIFEALKTMPKKPMTTKLDGGGGPWVVRPLVEELFLRLPPTKTGSLSCFTKWMHTGWYVMAFMPTEPKIDVNIIWCINFQNLIFVKCIFGKLFIRMLDVVMKKKRRSCNIKKSVNIKCFFFFQNSGYSVRRGPRPV